MRNRVFAHLLCGEVVVEGVKSLPDVSFMYFHDSCECWSGGSARGRVTGDEVGRFRAREREVEGCTGEDSL